jgi:DNA-binding XRE family transcriptional regulator
MGANDRLIASSTKRADLMSEAAMTTLEPTLLGFWTKCIREASHWSQEAVAASAGLDVRTIQRVEAGKPVSIKTRRALARGLGYENHDIFQDTPSSSPRSTDCWLIYSEESVPIFRRNFRIISTCR